jgi:hypothetical protein
MGKKRSNRYEIWGSDSDVSEDWLLLEYNAVLPGEELPTFRKSVLLQYSGWNSPVFSDFFVMKMEALRSSETSETNYQ